MPSEKRAPFVVETIMGFKLEANPSLSRTVISRPTVVVKGRYTIYGGVRFDVVTNTTVVLAVTVVMPRSNRISKRCMAKTQGRH